MFDTPEKRIQISKWIIFTVTCCILVYLGIRHINGVLDTVSWFVSLLSPLLIGVILALIFNIPMSFWERILKSKLTIRKGIRSLSIVLALFSVFGIFIGIIFLIVPELANAVKMIIMIAVDWLNHLAQAETGAVLPDSAVGQVLSKINIDWIGLKAQLESLLQSQSGNIVNYAVDTAGSAIGMIASFFIGLVFAIYILAGKEKLKAQAIRLIRAWFPEKFSSRLLHISSVCIRTFRLFITGQTIEAVILGTLCMIGMIILRIPYAPMIGALVGVTALIPVVGAFIGNIVGAIMILTVNPFKAVIFVIFLLVLQQIEGNLIYPKVVGSKINLPAIWVLAAVTIGGILAGPLGMLLGVPVMSTAYTLLREATEKRENKRKYMEVTI